MQRAFVRTLAVALCLASASEAQAQGPGGRFGGPYVEITPMLGYVFGGGFDTDALTAVPAGKLTLADNLGYGIEVGYSPGGATWVELTYLRQDTQISFDPNAGSTVDLGDFSTNYIHLGARQEFGNSNLRPFIGGGAGLVVYDPKGDYGTNTQFSMSIEGGARYMFGTERRFGLRATVRGWFGFVPDGTYGAWCDFYGFCYVSEGTATVTQGEVSGGVVITF